jgi:hypothetical protein
LSIDASSQRQWAPVAVRTQVVGLAVRYVVTALQPDRLRLVDVGFLRSYPKSAGDAFAYSEFVERTCYLDVGNLLRPEGQVVG